LTVAGPGVVHALAGMANAQSNCWPMVLVSAGPPTDSQTTGFFQETPQLEAAKIYAKFAVRVETLKKVKYFIHKAVRASLQGRPGAVYIEIASNVISDQKLSEEEVVEQFSENANVQLSFPVPQPVSCFSTIQRVHQLLLQAKRPLFIIGKGAAYARAEEVLSKLVTKTGIPFLPTPMGKGVISDAHHLCVGASRTRALKEADVIVLIGARLNWILHYGQEPRYSEDLKFVQFEIHPEEFHSAQPIHIPVPGDLKINLQQLFHHFSGSFPSDSSSTSSSAPAFKHQEETKKWLESLEQTKTKNAEGLEKKIQEDKTVPMGYHYVLYQLSQAIPEFSVIINEGANTMDLGRMILPNAHPRSRLDAGTTGTMGIGVGYAIAAAIAHPDRLVVSVQGDSAFGFSGMELETVVRFGLPIIFVVINNNGIYRGLTELPTTSAVDIPVTSLISNAHYEKIMEAFGGDGYFVTRPEEFESVLRKVFDGVRTKEAFENNRHLLKPTLINVMIKPEGPLPKILSH